MEEIELVDGSSVVTEKEAREILKKSNNKVSNGTVDAFVSLKDINKIYPNGVQAVYDFNIDINEHDFIVLVGPSGCGKSTTLRMVAGLEDITSGYLYINKVLSNYLPSKDRDISMVFQSYALYPQMTVYDNIAFPLRIRKYKKVKKAEVVEACDLAIEALKNKQLLLETLLEAEDKNYRFSTVVEYVAVKLNITDLAAKYLIKYNFTSENIDALAERATAELTALKGKEQVKLLSKKEGVSINDQYEILENGEKVYYEGKLTEPEIREKVFEAARILDLGPYLDRTPKELSGGQMQRVALGRAIVRNARLFLMDEPLSNLDAKLRVQMRSEIVRIHEQIGATTIYVTHDQTEAMTMATKIAVMSKGWVQQIGTPEEIYGTPRNIFVATFIGAPAMNILAGKYHKGVVTMNNGYTFKVTNEFKKIHDEFYKNKIADCERMLEQNDFKKMHGILVYDQIMELSFNDDLGLIEEKLNELKAIASTISDENGSNIVQYVDAITFKMHAKENSVEGQKPEKQLTRSEFNKFMAEIKKELLQIHDISSSDLGKLHNAQAFNKDEKKSEDIFYTKKKAKKEKKQKVNFRVNNLTFSNNLYQVCVELLEQYKLALEGEHEVNIGIRPENIHLSNEFTGKTKSDKFEIVSEVVELMGSELLIHSPWNDVDLISKISTGTLVRPHTNVELVFDLAKVHLFDVNCGDTIQ